MATMTKTDLEADVLALMQIGYQDAAKYNLPKAINLAQAHLLRTMPAAFLSNCVRSHLGNLVDGAESYTFPEGFVRVIQVWVSWTSAITRTNHGLECAIRDERSHRSKANFDKIGTRDFPVVTLGALGGWSVTPGASQDQTDGYRMKFVKDLPEITGSQPCLLNSRLRNVLIYYAANLTCRINNYRPDRAAEYMNMYKEERGLLIPKVDGHKEMQ